MFGFWRRTMRQSCRSITAFHHVSDNSLQKSYVFVFKIIVSLKTIASSQMLLIVYTNLFKFSK